MPITDNLRAPQGPCFPDLRGKTVLVTGGGSGIGRAISLRMGAEGMHVFLCGRTEETLLETAKIIRSSGGRATAVITDVSSPEEIGALFEVISQEARALDVLIHNAALMKGGTFAQTDPDYWRLIFATNLDSAYHLTKQACAMMVPREAGSIVFISTIGAVRVHHGMTAYDSSKWALEGFMRSLALELAVHGIRVNSVAPGATQNRCHDDEVPLTLLQQPLVPLGRRGLPAEMAAAAAFLASDQASYITGQTLCVDGGATAQIAPRGMWI
jgi:NAD(P)-dependent dehydrogenase (short-subunit alcohol dehydrogenase family)